MNEINYQNDSNKLDLEGKVLFRILKVIQEDSDDQYCCLQRILEITLENIGFDQGGIYLIDQTGDKARLICEKNFPKKLVEKFWEIPVHQSEYSQVMIKGEKLLIPDTDQLFPERFEAFQAKSIGRIPVKYGGKILGALHVSSKTRFVFGKKEILLLDLIAGELGRLFNQWAIEDNLNQERMNFELFFDSVEDFLFVLNISGAVKDVNQVALDRLGYSRDELIGKNLNEISSIDFDEVVNDSLFGIIGKINDNFTSTLTGKSGEEIPFENKLSWGKWKDEDVLICVARDISDRFKIEKIKQESYEQMGIEVQLRTEELRQANTDLSQQQYYIHALVDNIPDIAWLKDAQGRYIAANQSLAAMVGISKEDFKGKLDVEIWPEKFAEKFFEEDQLVLSSRKSVKQEEINKFITHEERWFETVKVPIFDQKGKAIGVAGISRDITERKRIQDSLLDSQAELQILVDGQSEELAESTQKLKEAEYRSRTILNALPDLIFVFDEHSNFVDIIPTRTIKLLKPPQDVIGSSVEEYTEIYSDEPFQQQIDRVLETGEMEITHYSVTDSVDNTKYYEARLVPYRENFVLSINRDITESRVAQDALRKSEEKQRLLTENATDMISLLNEDGIYQYVSPACRGILGYEPEEMIGHSVFDFYHREDFFVEKRIIEQISENDAISNRIRKKDGSYTWLETTSKVLYDSETTEIKEIISVSRDISVRKFAEDQLEAANQELEGAVLIANELAVAAEAASQAKSEFLANMSHEIRTPMNGVIGMVELLMDTELTAKQQDYVETIMQSGDALLSIINDILDFSKIEAGKLNLEKEPFYLLECLESSLDVFSLTAAEKQIELVCLVSEDVPNRVVGDVTRLRQILVNLIGNSFKFTQKGEIVLRVEIENLLNEQNLNSYNIESLNPTEVCLHISVQDTGIGIPLAKQKELFQSFAQLDSSTTRKFGGTGLGLAISKSLTNIMGGNIWVESEGIEGKGTTFHFTIFLQKNMIESYDFGLRNLDRLKGKKALVVEDNIFNQTMLSQKMKLFGMETASFDNAEDLLESKVLDSSFDLAIIDYQLPEMNGLDLAAEIHQIDEMRDLPIVLMHFAGKFDAIQKNEEISAMLSKPVKANRLQETISTILFDKKEKEPLSERTSNEEMVFDLHELDILLTEDNIINQKVAQRLLEKLNVKTDLAVNGVKAIEAMNTHINEKGKPYDIILMDVQMPEMDGEEATKRIRQDFSEREQPYIIAMTANALEGYKEHYLALGMNDYISKPVKLSVLKKALEEAFIVLKMK
ncbi:MAG: PAS domain S-box protein [Anaerolineaceae bacterium]|nr:PAS domain S-box protein [Anaerolineaceae bacterium]